jgi:hypothetical protein
LGARALAHGDDSYLGPGESATDPEVMAHELTHVAQTPDGQDVTQPLAVAPGSSPAEREADAMAAHAKSGAPPSQLIVDTAEALQPGQMTRDAFLAELRARATGAANAALAPEQSADDCPWFARHAETDAASIERMARRYSHLPTAERAADYIEPICSRVTAGIRAWKSGASLERARRRRCRGGAREPAAAARLGRRDHRSRSTRTSRFPRTPTAFRSSRGGAPAPTTWGECSRASSR